MKALLGVLAACTVALQGCMSREYVDNKRSNPIISNIQNRAGTVESVLSCLERQKPETAGTEPSRDDWLRLADQYMRELHSSVNVLSAIVYIEEGKREDALNCTVYAMIEDPGNVLAFFINAALSDPCQRSEFILDLKKKKVYEQRREFMEAMVSVVEKGCYSGACEYSDEERGMLELMVRTVSAISHSAKRGGTTSQ